MSSGEKVSSDMNLFSGVFSVARHHDFEISSDFWRFFDLDPLFAGSDSPFLSSLDEFLRFWKQKYREDCASWSDIVDFHQFFCSQIEFKVFDSSCSSSSSSSNLLTNIHEVESSSSNLLTNILLRMRREEELDCTLVKSTFVQEEANFADTLVRGAMRSPSSSTIGTVLGRTATRYPVRPDHRDCPKSLSEFHAVDLRSQAEEFPWAICLTCFPIRRIFSSERAFSCDLPPAPVVLTWRELEHVGRSRIGSTRNSATRDRPTNEVVLRVWKLCELCKVVGCSKLKSWGQSSDTLVRRKR
jgi:hypothetical protein